jgi:hypothetical protein
MDGIQLRFTNSRLVVSLILIGLLSLTIGGCQSGGDSPPASSSTSSPAPAPAPVATTAEGLWTGSTDTTPIRTILGAVLDDGTYYFFYSEQGSPNLIGGLIQGNSTASTGIFTSDNAKDFNFEVGGVQSGTIAGNYTERLSLNGSALSAGTGAFTTTFDPAYDSPPSPPSLAGIYTGQSGTPDGVESSTLTVDSNGIISGSAISGCIFIGTTTPRIRGNIFDLSVTFAGAPCLYPGETLAGIAYLDVPNKHLLAAVLTSTRTDVVLITGIRP